MKSQIANLKSQILLLLTLLAAPSAWAALSATVDPGYEFEAGERITLQKLNALGLPTVTVLGTVTGSTLSTNSVGKEHLKTNSFDQVTITGGDNATGTLNYDDWSIGVVSNKVAIKTNGVNTVHIATNAVTTTGILDATITGTDIATNTVSGLNMVTNWIGLYSAATNTVYGTNTPVVTAATNDLVVIGDVSNGTNMAVATVASLVSQLPIKAWCNFNGETTGTNVPLAGYNVTTVIRNGTGDYTVNFTAALTDTNYAVFAFANTRGVYGGSFQSILGLKTKTITSVTLESPGDTPSGTASDKNDISILIMQ